MIAEIGHNSGRVSEPGTSWRRHVWTKARKQLMPTLPLEVVRLRVRRAAELGLPYKTYAGIRASTGHDLIGFMFSSNALHVLRAGQDMPEARRKKLTALQGARRVGLAQRPVGANDLMHLSGIDAAHAAPSFVQSWSAMRDRMQDIIAAEGKPSTAS
ncbi:MAG: hypothetical protein AAFU41_12245 [Pseudomonadota bacterium]